MDYTLVRVTKTFTSRRRLVLADMKATQYHGAEGSFATCSQVFLRLITLLTTRLSQFSSLVERAQRWDLVGSRCMLPLASLSK